MAQACCVINPCVACNGVSSAPLKRNNTLCRSLFSCFDKTRKTSSITVQLAASSLAPGLQISENKQQNYSLISKSLINIVLNLHTFQLLNQNDNLASEYDYVTNYSQRFHAIKQ